MNDANWEKTKERMTALWEREIVDRCCIAIPVTPADGAYEAITQMSNDVTEEELKRSYTDAEYITEQCRKKFANTKFMGDALPCVFPNFGTAGFAQYTGSVPTYKPDTIWLSETLTGPDADQIFFDENIYQKHLQHVKELVKFSKNEHFVAMPDNCGVLDGLAAIRGTENLLFDVLEEPEFVKEGIKKLIDIQRKTLPGFYDAIRQNNDGGSTHAWMHLWSPKRVLQTQCDFSVMISPEQYKTFVLPELEATAEWADCVVYHLDGQEQIRHLDYILSVDAIKMIQWTDVAGQPPASEFIPVFQRIQKSGKGLVLLLQSWEVEKVMTQLSSRGLQIVVNDVHSEENAKELLKLAEKHTHS